MKNCINLFKFIQLAIIGLCFIKEKEDIHNHTKNNCVILFGSFVIFIILYILFIKCDIDKWVSIIISIILWIVFMLIKDNLCGFI